MEVSSKTKKTFTLFEKKTKKKLHKLDNLRLNRFNLTLKINNETKQRHFLC